MVVGGVEIDPVTGTSFRIDKIIFSNNRCEHLSPIMSSGTGLVATVRLEARTLSVVGNQVRSDPDFASFDFFPNTPNGGPSMLTAVSNVTSGDWTSRPPIIKPSPLESFNLMFVT